MKVFKKDFVAFQELFKGNDVFDGGCIQISQLVLNSRMGPQLNRFELALADYSKAIELQPDFADAYINRGVTHGKMGDLERSLTDLSEGIHLNPNDPNGYYNRGTARYKLEDFDGATEDFTQVLRMNPNDADVYFLRAQAHEQAGHKQQAIEDYETFLQLSGNPRAKAEVEQRIANLTEK